MKRIIHYILNYSFYIAVFWFVVKPFAGFILSEDDFNAILNFFPSWLKVLVTILAGIFGLDSFMIISPIGRKIKAKITRGLGFVEEAHLPVEEDKQERTKLWKATHDLAARRLILSLSLSDSNSPVSEREKSNFQITSRSRTFISYEAFQRGIDFTEHTHRLFINDIGQHRLRMLIGHAGTGKTYSTLTWLKQFTEVLPADILHCAVPVIVGIKNFQSENRENFEDWLAEEISKTYSLHAGRIKNLIRKNALFFCLDGLDEVSKEAREDCFEAILELSSISELLVSCRPEVFIELAERQYKEGNSLDWMEITELLPLEEAEIMEILRHNVVHVPELWEYVQEEQNRWILEFLRTPLLLDVTSQIFRNVTPSDKELLKNSDKESVLPRLWSIFDRQRSTQKITGEERRGRVRWWLHSLASVSRTGRYVSFDKIQPEWLTVPRRIRLYFLLSRVAGMIAFSIAFGFLVASPFTFVGTGAATGLGFGFLTILLNNDKAKQYFAGLRWEGLRKNLNVLLFVGIGVLISSFWRGLSVQRNPDDMRWLFSKTECLGGVLIGILSGLLFGIRKNSQDRYHDITMVDKVVHVKWVDIIKQSLIWMLVIGPIIGMIGFAISEFGSSDFTFRKWLIPFEQNNHLHPFWFPCEVGAIAAFVFGFLFHLKETAETDDNIEEMKGRKAIFHGIWSSLRFSFVAMACTFLFLGLPYGLFMKQLFGIESMLHGLKFGLGLALIAFLSFGGFEVISHFVLRLLLYFFDIAPFWMGKWLAEIQSMSVMVKVGSGMEFYHPTLKLYYENLTTANNHGNPIVSKERSPNAKLMFHWAAYILIGATAVFPLADRFYFDGYWNKPNRISFHSSSDADVFELLNDSIVQFKVSGKIQMEGSGLAHLGTYTGFSGPEGTSFALFGFPLKDTYNNKDMRDFPHGALMFRKRGEKKWKLLFRKSLHWLPDSKRTTSVLVNAGDVYEFAVNDLEWHNNSGVYRVFVDIETMAGKKK